MRNYLAVAAMAVFSTAALTSLLWADGQAGMAGDLHVTGPMLRATPPNAPVAGGFATIENRGDVDDSLIGASVAGDLVARVELHEMTMSEGVMSMSEVAGGIPIAAGETVRLAPGGLHIMLMGLSGPLVAGDAHEVTLTFEKAGELSMIFPVLTLAEIRASAEGQGASAGHGN